MDHQTTEEQKQRRLKEFETWFDEFTCLMRKGGRTVVFAPNAAANVNTMYWEILDNNIRPYMKRHMPDSEDPKIDRHKVASLIELVVAATLPIQHNNEETQRYYNALLAFCCSMNVAKNWNQSIQRKHMDVAFVTAHLYFLTYVASTAEVPVFSNAATWYLVEKLVEFNKAGKAGQS